ncbi:MAG: hypothetical protein KA797_07260 [Chitinophagales bacterium]|nr:hypothetical protein [Chitinophagales bacterium]
MKRLSEDTIHFQISIEKYIGKNWILYSEDAMGEPNSKPLICGLLDTTTHAINFKIKLPSLIERKPNGTFTPVTNQHQKVGQFRIKLIYGLSFDMLSEYMYLPEFKISEPKKRKN